MKVEYQLWIGLHLLLWDETHLGTCQPVCRAMQTSFPELALVRGHYHCPEWGRRGHWWLLTPDGEVIDPTVAQFPSGGSGEYEKWDESKPEPTGGCHNCGVEVFNNASFCSDKCTTETIDYLNSSKSRQL